MTGFGGYASAMNARRLRNVTEYFSGGINDHHVGAARDKYVPRRGFNSNVIRASVALDVEFLNLEILSLPKVGHNKADCENNRECGYETCGHTPSVMVTYWFVLSEATYGIPRS